MRPKQTRQSAKKEMLAQWVRADRVLGLPFREIAKRHGLCLATAFRWSRDVSPVRWSTKLQRARYDKPERPLPSDPRIHAYLCRS